MSETLLRTWNTNVHKTVPIPNVTSTIQKIIEIGVMHKRKLSFSKYGFHLPIPPMFSAEEHEIMLY